MYRLRIQLQTPCRSESLSHTRFLLGACEWLARASEPRFASLSLSLSLSAKSKGVGRYLDRVLVTKERGMAVTLTHTALDTSNRGFFHSIFKHIICFAAHRSIFPNQKHLVFFFRGITFRHITYLLFSIYPFFPDLRWISMDLDICLIRVCTNSRFRLNFSRKALLGFSARGGGGDVCAQYTRIHIISFHLIEFLLRK